MSSKKRLRKQEVDNKISKASIQEKRGSKCPQYPAFSFLHLTANKKHNFSFFSKSMEKQRHEVLLNLHNKVCEICGTEWEKWVTHGKYNGCEKIESSKLKFDGKGVRFTPDEKVYIFRFDTTRKDGGRIIGFRKEKCPTLYVIGYDFDFSAYPHGS